MMDRGLRHLIQKNLGISNAEEILVLFDEKHQNIASVLLKVCQELRVPCKARSVEFLESRALPKESLNILRDENGPQELVFILSNSIWHTPERWYAKYELKKRVVEILGTEEQLVSNVSIVDPNELEELAKSLGSHLKKGARFEITSERGTNLTAVIDYPFSESGLYTKPGTGGDFPAGEVGFIPLEGSVNGKIVFDLKIQHVGVYRDDFLTVEIENDKITNINGPESDRFLKLIDLFSECQFIAEISLGINPAVQCDFLDLHHITEEKKLGTAHFGFGANYPHGTRNGYHFDGVIQFPTARIDTEVIAEKGNLIPDILAPATMTLPNL